MEWEARCTLCLLHLPWINANAYCVELMVPVQQTAHCVVVAQIKPLVGKDRAMARLIVSANGHSGSMQNNTAPSSPGVQQSLRCYQKHNDINLDAIGLRSPFSGITVSDRRLSIGRSARREHRRTWTGEQHIRLLLAKGDFLILRPVSSDVSPGSFVR